MSDYSVIAADGSCSFATFDRYRVARELHERLSKKSTVNLICMHGCGCVYRALVKHERHVGWRRSEACAKHRRSQPFEKHGLNDSTLKVEKGREAEMLRVGTGEPR